VVTLLTIKKLNILPTQCISVFCMDLRTNSNYFTIQHTLTGFCNLVGSCWWHSGWFLQLRRLILMAQCEL